MNTNSTTLLHTVIDHDYCIGCGACASLTDSPFEIKINEDGKYRAYLKKEISNQDVHVTSVCPFASGNKNETEIGKELFEKYNATFNEYTGYYMKNFAGYVIEGNYREKGSSGGMGNWICAKLLQKNLVDHIIHVKEAANNKALFTYQISSKLSELAAGAKSKYYPVELSEVMDFVKENEATYAIVGIPCFIKAVRLLAKREPMIEKRVKYCISLVCGHLKSEQFAKSISWQLGIEPERLTAIDFRKKLSGRTANDYGVEVQGGKDRERKVVQSPTKDLYTTDWGQGFFKYTACEFCDDVLGETADVTVGDAWLPKYAKDSSGTNIITVRNPVILSLLEKNAASKAIYMEELTTSEIYQSQAGGFRHRRDGLSYRLYLKDKQNEWRPEKRVEPSDALPQKRKSVYENRMLLTKESFNAYKIAEEKNDFQEFISYMDPKVKMYDKLVRQSFIKRALRKIKREITSFISSV